MRTNKLTQIKTILAILKGEKIRTPDSDDNQSSVRKSLSRLRNTTLRLVAEQQVTAPGFTSNSAVTLAKLGAYQELCQRFILEYSLKYKAQDISLLFLGNRDEANPGKGLVVLLVGNISCSKDLLIGSGDSSTQIPHASHRVQLSNFLKSQHVNCIIVNPLTHSYFNLKKNYDSFISYCEHNKSTHVIAVRNYSQAGMLIKNAPNIKEKAQEIAASALQLCHLEALNNATPDYFSKKWIFNSDQNGFYLKGPHDDLQALRASFIANGFPQHRIKLLANTKGKWFLGIKNARELELQITVDVTEKIIEKHHPTDIPTLAP